MDDSSSNSIADLSTHFSLLDYHQKAMESRRQIQFRVFLSLAALCLVLTKGMAELPYHGILTKISLTIMFVILWVLFIGLVVQMEVWNKSNREKYRAIEEFIFNTLRIMPKKETCCETLKFSWAGTWPVVGLLFLLLGCCVFVWALK